MLRGIYNYIKLINNHGDITLADQNNSSDLNMSNILKEILIMIIKSIKTYATTNIIMLLTFGFV